MPEAVRGETVDLANLRQAVTATGHRYHQLLLLVGQEQNRRQALLQALATESGEPILHVSIVLAEALLPLPRAERVPELGGLLDRVVAESAAQIVFVDDIEILFSPELRVDVLSRLRQLSRNRIVVVNWPGEWVDGCLTYAEVGHPEFFQAQADAVSVFTVSELRPSSY